MKKLLISALMAASLSVAPTISLAARSAVPMLVPQRVTVTSSAGEAPGAEAIKNAIIRAGEGRGWAVREQKPGEVVLWLDRKEGKEAVVSVSYDDNSFHIRYVSSEGQLYDEKDGVPQIHPLYNGWIIKLGQDIGKIARR